MRDSVRTAAKPRAPWALLAVLAALVFVAWVRLRLADVPLERDEGEYAYAGRLILEGIPPYELAYNMKFPGTYYAFALILALFGKTPWGIHFGLMLVNAATVLLVFAVGRRLLGDFSGAVAAVSYAILSVDRWVLGVFAHATHFVVLAVMAGLLLLLRAIDDRRTSSYLWSGLFLGMAVLMKQHAIFFLPGGALLVVWSGNRGGVRAIRASAKRVGMMALGAVIPFAAAVFVLAAQGVLGRFWFWTIRYASAYVTEVPPAMAWSNFSEGIKYVTTANLAFWVLGALGLAALWIRRWAPRANVALTGLLAASILAICPGFYFRSHYFILVLPAIALSCGAALGFVRHALEAIVPRGGAVALAGGVLIAAIGLYVTHERDYLFSMSPRRLSRTTYDKLPFIEAEEIGKYLRDRTDANDRIAVLGSEPEIYFYADRKSATGYIYTYPLVEPQPYAASMQDEMIREIESAHPRYLVFSHVEGSWSMRRESDQRIVRWGHRYASACYDPAGIVDIVSEDDTRILWGDEALNYKAASPNLVFTFRRKSDAPCAVGK